MKTLVTLLVALLSLTSFAQHPELQQRSYAQKKVINSINSDRSKILLVSKHYGDETAYSNRFFNPAPVELIENSWYLHNLIVNGVDNIPPFNEDVPYIQLGFSDMILEYDFITGGCSAYAGFTQFDNEASNFLLFDTFEMFFNCNDQVIIDYQNLYFAFFNNNLAEPFGYLLNIVGEEKTLIITDIIGSQAIYGNWTLAVDDFLETNISFYPNPVTDFLYVESSTITKIEVLDLLGKIVSTKTDNFNQIDFTKSMSGVYFVKFYAGNTVITRKIIKK